MIEVCGESPNEARQRSIPGSLEYGRARCEEGLVQPSQAMLTKGKEFVIGEERQPRMIGPKNLEIGRWKKNERSKP
jgi:hypothetical protein